MYSMFLGQPHQSIVDWINGHHYDPPTPPGPSGHTDTRVTYVEEQGIPQWSGEIQGELKRSDIPDIEYIKTIDIGTNVTSIEEHTFLDCYELRDVIISNVSTITIKSSAFSNCPALETLEFENNAIVEEQAFAGCNNLHTVTIQDSIPSFADYAFPGFHPNFVFQNKTRDEIISSINNHSINWLMFGDSGNATFTITCSDKSLLVYVDDEYNWNISLYSQWTCTMNPSNLGEVFNIRWKKYDDNSWILLYDFSDIGGHGGPDYSITTTNENATTLTAMYECYDYDCSVYGHPITLTFTRTEL